MSKKKILITEDEIMLLEVLKERFEHEGYEIITAEIGSAGLVKAISENPDLFIIDLMMPEMDGFELIKLLRSNSDSKEKPIIVVSALGREKDIKRAMELGANRYFTKPTEPKELSKTIKELLQ